MVRTERGCDLRFVQGDVSLVGAITKIIEITRLELFYEGKSMNINLDLFSKQI